MKGFSFSFEFAFERYYLLFQTSIIKQFHLNAIHNIVYCHDDIKI